MTDFNTKQIEKLQELVKEFYKLNNTFNSNRKIENIKTFQDKENNLYISYLGKFMGIEGQTIGDFYLKINTNGEEEKLNYTMDTVNLKEYFETLKEIKL
jgi:hypothetical protein